MSPILQGSKGCVLKGYSFSFMINLRRLRLYSKQMKFPLMIFYKFLLHPVSLSKNFKCINYSVKPSLCLSLNLQNPFNL